MLDGTPPSHGAAGMHLAPTPHDLDAGGLTAPGGPPSSRPRARTNSTTQQHLDGEAAEMQNERAVQVLNRVKEKLHGLDFGKVGQKTGSSGQAYGNGNDNTANNHQSAIISTSMVGGNAGVGVEGELNFIDQVDRLLIEATKLENLCQHYIGWCSFW